jgi:hypothetical protein
MVLITTDVSGERVASIIRVKHAVKKYQFLCSVLRFLVTANVSHSLPIPVTLMMEAKTPPKSRFLQELYGVTSQKTAFFVVTVVKTSTLTQH